jgi:hypothetical protein
VAIRESGKPTPLTSTTAPSAPGIVQPSPLVVTATIPAPTIKAGALFPAPLVVAATITAVATIHTPLPLSVSVTIPTPVVVTPAEPAPPAAQFKLQNLSVWTDIEANSGTLLNVFHPLELLACSDTVGLDNEEKLTATVKRSAAAWSDVVIGRVIRAEMETGEFDEWRIVSKESASATASEGTIECEGIIYDLLRRSGIVEITESDGFTDHDIHISNLTPSQWFDLVEASPNFPAYITKGTVEPMTRVTVPIDGDRPLRVFREMRDALDQLGEQKPNLRMRRNVLVDYKLDVMSELGSTAELAFIGSAKNLQSIRHRESGLNLATQAYVFGGGPEGSRLGMQGHQFTIAAQTATTVDLGHPDGSSRDIIKIDDLLNGFYLENIDDSSTNAAITDTAAANDRLTFSAVPGTWSVGDRVVVRRNAALDGLNYLTHPVNAATHGNVVAKVDRRDIVAIDNELANPLLDQFTGAQPNGWSAIGGAVFSQQTARPWWLNGGSSLKIVAGDGEGVESNPVTIRPSATNPFYVGQAMLIAETLATGARVAVQIVDVDTGEPFPALGNEASVLGTTLTPTLVSVATGINWQLRGTSQLKLRITVEGGTSDSTIYLDSANLYRGVNAAQNVVEGFASNKLWDIAQDVLRGQAGTPIDEFDVQAVDLNRTDQTTYPHDAIEVGGTVVLKNADLGIDVQTRIVRRVRNLLVPGDTTITLSDKRADLTGLIGKRPITAAIDASPPRSGDQLSSGRGVAVMDFGTAGAAGSSPVGRWTVPGAMANDVAQSSANMNAGELLVAPFTLTRTMNFDQVATSEGGAGGGGKVRVGIYRDTGLGTPGNVLFQSGDLTFDGTTGIVTVTGLSIDLEVGQTYWSALQMTLDDSAGINPPELMTFGLTGVFSGDLGNNGTISGSSSSILFTGQGGSMPNPAPDIAVAAFVGLPPFILLRRAV